MRASRPSTRFARSPTTLGGVTLSNVEAQDISPYLLLRCLQ